MRRDVAIIAALWVASTAVGLALVLTITPFPIAASEGARFVDDTFTLLTLMAIPVFTFVVSMLGYSAYRFRSDGNPGEDGPPIRGHRLLIGLWIAVTAALTILLIVHPGITGINEVRSHESESPDLVVDIEGRRWSWRVTYPQRGVYSTREMVLPVDERARFRVTAVENDVLHSFWIPAFRMKIDAVPGMITTTAAKPDVLGDFETDANFRLQCAELCGRGHAVMRIPVRVVDRAEFEEWLGEQRAVSQSSSETGQPSNPGPVAEAGR